MHERRAPSLNTFILAGTCSLAACVDNLPVGQATDTDTTTASTTQPGTGTETDPTTSTTSEPTTTTASTTSPVTTTDDSTTAPITTTDDSTTTPVTSTDSSTTDVGTTTTTTGDSTTTTTGDTTTDTDTGSTTDPGDTWQPPQCASVTGTGAVTFSHDEGATLAPMDQQIVPVTYTFGLVALGKPGAMLAGSKMEILASSDAGCTWHSIGPAGDGNSPALRLNAAGDTRAYGWGDNNPTIVRVDDEVIHKLTSPTGQEGIVGLGVDPNDPDHVRLGDSAGRLWDSTDAGEQWQQVGVTAFAGSLAYRAAFDPQDLDHALFGTLAQGVRVTHDAGGEWTSATGLSVGSFNGFNLVVSPALGDIVWVEGLDLADPNDATSRHIYRSEDGGLSFVAVVDADEATLYNGNHLFAHPTDTDVLYFVYGQNFGNYGTDLFRYDYGADAITLTHNKWHDTIVAFLPGDPSWMYLGLSIEPGGG